MFCVFLIGNNVFKVGFVINFLLCYFGILLDRMVIDLNVVFVYGFLEIKCFSLDFIINYNFKIFKLDK